MSIRLFLDGDLDIRVETLVPMSESMDIEVGGKFSHNVWIVTWLGKKFRVEKSCRGSVPFLFFFLSKLFRCQVR